METTELPVPVLRERMRARHITLGRFAVEAGVYPNDLSRLFRGTLQLGPRRMERIGAAVVRLGLDRDEAPPPPPAEPVVIRIRKL